MDMQALLAKIFGGASQTAGISGGAGSMVPTGGPSKMQGMGSLLALLGDTGSKALGGTGAIGGMPATQPTAPAGQPDIMNILAKMFAANKPAGGGMAPMPGAHNPVGGSQMSIGTGGYY